MEHRELTERERVALLAPRRREAARLLKLAEQYLSEAAAETSSAGRPITASAIRELELAALEAREALEK